MLQEWSSSPQYAPESGFEGAARETTAFVRCYFVHRVLDQSRLELVRSRHSDAREFRMKQIRLAPKWVLELDGFRGTGVSVEDARSRLPSTVALPSLTHPCCGRTHQVMRWGSDGGAISVDVFAQGFARE